MIIKSDLQKIKKARTLIKMFSLDSFITDVSIFCLCSRHSNRRSHQCIFWHLFYVKITLFNKDKMLEKVLKIKNFHPFSRCSNTTHSTCCICGTQKVWVNLLRINCVLPTSSHTRRGSRGQNECHLSMSVLGNISTAFLGLSVDGNISTTLAQLN